MRSENRESNRDRTITIPVRMDSKTLRSFALFDAFVVKRHWRRPALFSALLLAFAMAALLLRREQSALIAAILLAVGLGLPILYIGMFFGQVNVQALRNRLTPPRLVYTVKLDEDGILVQNHQRKEDVLRLSWQELYRAYRLKNCVYLYAALGRAFLLPTGQADAADGDLWAFIAEHMPGKTACPFRAGAFKGR